MTGGDKNPGGVGKEAFSSGRKPVWMPAAPIPSLHSRRAYIFSSSWAGRHSLMTQGHLERFLERDEPVLFFVP
jgi:hypothetical protein